jgi:hypothetical protein
LRLSALGRRLLARRHRLRLSLTLDQLARTGSAPVASRALTLAMPPPHRRSKRSRRR